jgi:predicted secreted protein
MNAFSAFAIYFIIWWVSLFAVLSLGLRTQADSGSVEPGTTASAPAGRHMLRVAVINTIIATVIFAAFYWAYAIQGWRFDDLPNVLPSRQKP